LELHLNGSDGIADELRAGHPSLQLSHMKIGVQEQKRVRDCMDNIWHYQGTLVKALEKRMKKN
jgi:hypothetical protein